MYLVASCWALAAAEYGRLLVVQFLVGRGADVDATDNDGLTPRDWAEQLNHTAVVEYFGHNSAWFGWAGLTTTSVGGIRYGGISYLWVLG